jgi:hypothetical protein
MATAAAGDDEFAATIAERIGAIAAGPLSLCLADRSRYVDLHVVLALTVIGFRDRGRGQVREDDRRDLAHRHRVDHLQLLECHLGRRRRHRRCACSQIERQHWLRGRS